MSESSPPAGTSAPAPGSKAEAIVDAAAEVFREKGFAATRISDIAAAAGVGKGTVYEYYRAKEEILLAAVLRICKRNELTMAGGEELDPSVGFGAPPGANPVRILHDTLVAVIATLLRSSRTEFRLFSDLQHAAHEQPELLARARQEVEAKLGQWRTYCQAQLEQGIEAGLLRRLDELEWVSRMCVATVDGLIWQQMWHDEDPQPVAEGIARSWCRLCMVEPDRLQEYLA